MNKLNIFIIEDLMPEYKLSRVENVKLLTKFLKERGFSVIEEFDVYTYRHDIYQVISFFHVHHYYRMIDKEADKYLTEFAMTCMSKLTHLQLFDELTEGRHKNVVFWLPPDSTTI